MGECAYGKLGKGMKHFAILCHKQLMAVVLHKQFISLFESTVVIFILNGIAA